MVQGFKRIHHDSPPHDALSINLNQITVTLDPLVDTAVEQIRFVRATN